MSAPRKQQEKDAVELSEEAAFLLRNSPASVWACYYLGTMPFVLGLLYFWSNMTRGQPGTEQVLLGSLGLAGLFLWMKTWQGIFGLRLRDVLTDSRPEPMTWRGVLRMAAGQARWQPWGLIILPVTLVLTVPFPWTYAYFQNLTATASPERSSLELHRAAAAEAKLWPMQNSLFLLILSGLGLFVFANVVTTLILLPQIMITFFGMKEILHPGLWYVTNTTFLALAGVMTHLVIDPFVKAAYVVRSFYGQSRNTGEDLRVQLNRARRAGKGRLREAALAGFFFCCVMGSQASEGAASAPRPEQLDQEITSVLEQTEYSWKFPREVITDGEKGWLTSFFESVANFVGDMVKGIFAWIRRVVAWFRDTFSSEPISGNGSGFGNPQLLLYIALGLVAVCLLVLLWRYRAKAERVRQVAAVEAAAVELPDIRDEQVRADQLPQDEWLRLAQELFAQGELRLAIRALFLSALSDLAKREIISIEKFKSNRDYDRELRRRSLAAPERAGIFGNLVALYDRVWYGAYEVSGEMFSECEEKVRVLKSC